MTDATVTVTTDGERVSIVVAGEIDLANAGTVEEQIHQAITNQVTTASIDLSDVTYLDSAGLRILFTLAARLPVLQIALVLVAPVGSPARRVIELSGLDTLSSLQPPAR